jgi:hypothetical protein
VVLEYLVFHIDGLWFPFLSGAGPDVPMVLAVFPNEMAPEFPAATGFASDFELDPPFLFVFGELHGRKIAGPHSSNLIRPGFWRNKEHPFPLSHHSAVAP